MYDKLDVHTPSEAVLCSQKAARGFIARLPGNGVIKADDGRVVSDMTPFHFIKEGSPAPETVNPSLWRQAQLILKGGLFKHV